MNNTPTHPELLAKHNALLKRLAELESCAVAFSGGVDSAVVAKAAQLALGAKAVAVTANSPSVAQGEVEQAVELAKLIGIQHRVISTQEMQNPAYRRNAPDRCYHCKTELYGNLTGLLDELGVSVVVSGNNADDLGDYRPGLQAASEHRVCSPLAECGITKSDVRQLAALWQLPVSDKPATPCLSSRIAYGEEVTPDRLRMIDQAEQFLRRAGLPELRVRYHRGDLARVEVPLSHLSQFCQSPFREQFITHLRSLGFLYITLDLQGFRSGSHNSILSSGGLPMLV